MTKQASTSMKLQKRLSLGLAAATLVVAVLFFAGSVLLNESWFAALVVQTRLTLESFVAVFAISAVVLSAGAFLVSWKQMSLTAAGLLTASGVVFIIHPLTTFFSHVIHPQVTMGHSMTMWHLGAIPWGPILVVILGSAILGLSLAKGISTARTSVV